MRITLTIAGVALGALLSPLASHAAIITGEFWDADTAINSLADADAVIASGSATATFLSSGIDYPGGADSIVADTTTLADFLGADAATLSGSGGTDLERSVFRFSGMVELMNIDQMFSVGSDDGFRLSIGGSEVSAFDGKRSFGTTDLQANLGSGLVSFELVYFENRVETGVLFTIDDEVVTPDITPIPLPASGWAGLLALLGLGVFWRRRSARAAS